MTDPTQEPMHPTKERLAKALDEARLPDLARRARAGEFDDFESPHLFPKLVLTEELERAKRRALADRVREGEYDNTSEEARAYMASPRGQADLRAVYEEGKGQ